MSPSESEVAWAAGLFEGEGCISGSWVRNKSRKYWYAQLRLSMTDRDVVERFSDVVGVGYIRMMQPAEARHKTQWCWLAGRLEDVTRALGLLEPWFGERRSARVAEALAQDSRLKPKPPPATHCRNGHPWDEANTYKTAKGSRVCRACARDNARHRLRTDPVYAATVRKASREWQQRRRDRLAASAA